MLHQIYFIQLILRLHIIHTGNADGCQDANQRLHFHWIC